jgi:hypothetical protein
MKVPGAISSRSSGDISRLVVVLIDASCKGQAGRGN